MNRFRTLSLLSLAILGGCSSGENNAKTYPVTGVVTKGGAPVEGASVIFVPTDNVGQAAFGTTDSTGKYSLRTFKKDDGAVPGTYRIKVTKSTAAPAAGQAKVYANSEEEQADYNPDAKPAPVPKNALPPNLANETTSQLTHTVPTSPSTFDIPIK
jgi:hypothetical protein